MTSISEPTRRDFLYVATNDRGSRWAGHMNDSVHRSNKSGCSGDRRRRSDRHWGGETEARTANSGLLAASYPVFIVSRTDEAVSELRDQALQTNSQTQGPYSTSNLAMPIIGNARSSPNTVWLLISPHISAAFRGSIPGEIPVRRRSTRLAGFFAPAMDRNTISQGAFLKTSQRRSISRCRPTISSAIP